MAIYHLSAQVVSRGKGRSCVAAAAYRAGEKILDERTGLTHDYTRKAGVAHKEILAPNQAPDWVFDRHQLWNQVEAAEKRKDAQTAREINIALPNELTLEENIELAREYVNDSFVRYGMIADINIHMNDLENPHAHIMLTTREIGRAGFGGKNREWNRTEFLEQWRGQWQEYANRALRKARVDEQIDHRSHRARGIEQVPTVHEGPAVRAMEQKGMKTERGEWNREAKKINVRIKELKQAQTVELQKYKELKEELQAEKDKWYYFRPEEKRAVLSAKDTLGRFADMSSVRQEISVLNQAIQELGIKRKAIEATEMPFTNAEHYFDRIDRCQAVINKMSFKDRHFGELKPKYKQTQDRIKEDQRALSGLGFKDRDELNRSWVEFKKQKKARLNQLEKTRDELEVKINILKAAEKALTMAEIRRVASQYHQDINPKAFLALSYDEAKSINDLNKEIGKVLPLDEIQELARRGNSIVDDSHRLERAGELVARNEGIQEQLTHMESPIEKAKRIVSWRAKNEYKELIRKSSDIQDAMRAVRVQDRADLNRQVQDNHIAINRFPASFGLGFLKALEVINRAAQAAGRVQYADRYRRLEDERENSKRFGSYEHER